MSLPPAPVSLFYSYAHEDEALRDELQDHLTILERRRLLTSWHDRRIPPGADWAAAIDERLQRADVVLLLLSTDFINSDYIMGAELALAMQRHRAGEAEVVPVMLRPVDLQPEDAEDLPFLKLQGLPPDLKPVTTWPNRDEAWVEVAKGLRQTVKRVAARRAATDPMLALEAPRPPAGGAGDPFAGYLLPRPAALPTAAPAAAPAPDAPPRGTPAPRPPPAPLPDDWDPFATIGGAAAVPREPAGGEFGGLLQREFGARPAPMPPPDARLSQLLDRVGETLADTQRARGGATPDAAQVRAQALALVDIAAPRRVLWVDDHPEHNRHEIGVFAKLQIEVVTVRSTDEALARLAAGADPWAWLADDEDAGFQLVISDWSRDGEPPDAGLHLLARMRAAGHAQPLVIYHGEFDAARRERRRLRARDAGAHGEAVLPAELLTLALDVLGR